MNRFCIASFLLVFGSVACTSHFKAKASGSTEASSVDTPAPSGFSAITPPNGTLITPTGKWRFGTVAHDGGSQILLNDQPAGLAFTTEYTDTFLGAGLELVADNSTHDIYVRSMSGLWYQWNNIDQWTPAVTGDPRRPITPPALGPNLVQDADFATGYYNSTGGLVWFSATTNDAPCNAANNCVAKVENLSPLPGGKSIHLNSTTGAAEIGDFPGVKLGNTYLMSVWTMGTGSLEIHEEHDVNGTRGAKILPSTGWVQTMCKFSPQPIASVGPQMKIYAKEMYATEFYVGLVDPSYPAPDCQKQTGTSTIPGY